MTALWGHYDGCARSVHGDTVLARTTRNSCAYCDGRDDERVAAIKRVEKLDCECYDEDFYTPGFTCDRCKAIAAIKEEQA